MKSITGVEAVQRIEREFPTLSSELHDEIWDGLLHLQISVFSRFAQAAIDAGDRLLFKRICGLFLELFKNGSAELVNALNVSFLEHLNFDDGKELRHWAYDSMPEGMRVAYEEMEDYNRQLHKNR